MTPRLALAAAALAFVLLATANSAGYRYGNSDQAFYMPAVAIKINPALFPRDRTILAAQMRLWFGSDLFAWLSHATGRDLPMLFALVYIVALVLLFAAAITLAGSLGCDSWTTAAFLILLTLRHRITKTGANSLEGYMHPRTLAFALGLLAIACAVRRRFVFALVITAAAAVIHPTTAMWFGVVVGVAGWWPNRHSKVWLGAIGAGAVALAIVARTWLATSFVWMDAAWLAAIGDKDYLFAASWPLYAWAINLAYPVVIVLIYRRRRRLGVEADGEGAVVAGLVALVGVFLLSVPLTAMHLALAVQLQVNRGFWVLDAVALLYIAWWGVDVAARWSPRARSAVVIGLAAIAVARGSYLVPRDRPFVEIGLPAGAWTNAMTWLAEKPLSWHVLADPSHAWRYSTSVRVGALKDTLLESSKDTALAIYDRDVAMRVAERSAALANFETFSAADVRALAARYDLDVFIDRTSRTFDFPVLFKNDQFVIYSLR